MPPSTSSPLPSLYQSFLSPSPLLSFHSFPLEVGPLYIPRGSDECVSSPSGVWGVAQRKANFVHFSLRICHPAAPILLIFLRIHEYTGQLLVRPNALWPRPKLRPTLQRPHGQAICCENSLGMIYLQRISKSYACGSLGGFLVIWR